MHFLETEPVSPRRIVFTGDFLRPNPAGDRPTQHHNIRWLRNLVSSQLAMATRLPHSVFSWGAADVNDGGLGIGDVQAFYQLLALPLTIKAWASIHAADRLPWRLEAVLDHVFHDSLVVGFELPPYLEKFLTRRRIPWVGFTVHPVRFLDDLLLGTRSNIPAVQERIFPHRISEDYIRTMAGVQKAAAARYFPDKVRDGSALFLMQTWYDQSQIENGEFVSAERYIDQIAGIAAQHQEFLIKEHPMAPNPATPVLRARIANHRMVKGNVYGYLSIPEIRTIATISSSVRQEAGYFGVAGRALLGDAVLLRRYPGDPAHGFVGIEGGFLAPDFWRDILAPVMPVTPADGVRVPCKPNRLRTSIRAFWSFNEIDTDIAVSLVRRA